MRSIQYGIAQSLLRHYLAHARRRLAAGKGPFFKGRLDGWPAAQAGVQILEHWLEQSAFRTTRRSLANLDYAIAGTAGGEPKAILRGWIFDLVEPVAAVRIGERTEGSMCVYGEQRVDVLAAFPGERRSDSCGFLAVVPREAAGRAVKLTYETPRGGSFSFELPCPALSFGVRHPQAVEPEIEPASGATVGILVLPGESVGTETRRLVECALADGNGAAICGESQALDTLAGELGGAVERLVPTRAKQLSDFAAFVGAHREELKQIVIAGECTEESYRQIVPAAVAASPIVPIAWICDQPDWYRRGEGVVSFHSYEGARGIVSAGAR